MDEKVTALCESFITNREIIKKVFKGESLLIYPVAANALVSHGVTADEDKLKECRKLIKKNSGALSYLKGQVMMPFAANLSMKEDPKAHFDKVLKIYNVAKKKFNRSEYSALLAILLADLIHEDSCEAVLTRGKELYDQIKMAHPFLTNEQDSVLARLLALSEKSNTELIDDMEKCFDLLKIKFSHKSSIQSISHVLALTEGSAREKVEHLNDLYDSLREAGKKFGVYTELSTLAAVSILDNETERVRDRIIGIDDFLSKQKGYGLLGLDKKARLMHATMLTTDLYDSAQIAQTTASTSAIAMAAAQSLAVCVIITSTIAANSASTSN